MKPTPANSSITQLYLGQVFPVGNLLEKTGATGRTLTKNSAGFMGNVLQTQTLPKYVFRKKIKSSYPNDQSLLTVFHIKCAQPRGPRSLVRSDKVLATVHQWRKEQPTFRSDSWCRYQSDGSKGGKLKHRLVLKVYGRVRSWCYTISMGTKWDIWRQ